MHDDPRAALRDAGQPYIYAVLHAHQVAAIMDAEPGTGAMVSRSADGQIIVPILRIRRCIPVRGSSRKHGQDKGGRAALEALIEHVSSGRPGYLAVDGPRGPRGRVHKGVALLARRSGAAVVTIAAIPSRRWTLRGSWDRLQIPKPFSTITGYFGAPLTIADGESLEAFARRIEQSLADLEQQHDPAEAAMFSSSRPAEIAGMETAPEPVRVDQPETGLTKKDLPVATSTRAFDESR